MNVRCTTYMRGLSLIELLVVIAIISAVATAAVFNAPEERRPVQLAAERFALALKIAADEAAISARPARLVIEPRAYRFERYVSPDWTPIEDARFVTSMSLPNEMVYRVSINSPFEDNKSEDERTADDGDDNGARFYLIDPAGLGMSLEARFEQGRDQWIVRRGADGVVEAVRVR